MKKCHTWSGSQLFASIIASDKRRKREREGGRASWIKFGNQVLLHVDMNSQRSRSDWRLKYHKGSYVLLFYWIIRRVGKIDKWEACRAFYLFFLQFNNTGAQMLDYFYAPAMTMAGALSVTPVRLYLRKYTSVCPNDVRSLSRILLINFMKLGHIV